MFIWQFKCVKKTLSIPSLWLRWISKGEGFKALELCQVGDVEHKFFIINFVVETQFNVNKVLDFGDFGASFSRSQGMSSQCAITYVSQIQTSREDT